MSYSKSYTRVHTTGWENEQDSYNTPLSAENLNIMDAGIDTLDDRIVSLDNAKADLSVLSNVFKDVSLNEQTGVLTFTKFDGTTKTLDTMLEKVVTNFDFDETTQKLTITLEDGTTKQVDLSSFISEYEFTDTDTIAWTVVNHKAVASVKNHSIGADQLETDYLTNCQLAQNNAQGSATSASSDALESEGWAKGTQNGVPVSSTSQYYQNNAKYYSDHAGTKTLASLDDVQISNVADKQSLVYDSTLGKWVNGDAIPQYKLSAPTNTSIDALDESVSIKWTDPSDLMLGDNKIAEWDKTVIVQKIGSAPTSIDDGTTVLESSTRDAYSTDAYVVSGLTNDVTYYFGIFPVTTSNVATLSCVLSATPEVGLGIRNWCASIGLTYENLADITETDMRTLMTKHASVEYFMTWYNSDATMIDQFISNQYAMKWIGLRDYICDKLMAISDFKTKALASDNWEFILKDHVPIMTSASAPYGKASASSTYSTDYAWQAFDGNNSTRWVANASDSYIDYEFTNPICVRKVYYYSLTYVTKVSLHGSNGGTWTKIGEYECSGVFNQDGYFEIDNNNYYKSYRIKSEVIMSSSATMQAMTLQFYGRALNVSVPTMTGNSSPYGEVSVDYKGASADVRPTNQAYMAFLSSGLYASPHLVGQSVSYDFGRPIIVKYVTFTLDDANAHTSSDKVKVQGSNDKTTWVDLSDSLGGGARPTISTTINNNVAYRYYQIVVAELTSASSYFQIRSINFFGLDYSERSDRTYLYDHGVEVVPMSTYASGSGVTISKNANDITISDTTTSYWGVAGTTNAIDLTAYSKVRAIVADKYATSVSGGFIISTTRNALASWSSFANANITSVMLPYGINLDVSSVNESVRVGLVTTSSNTDASMNFNELWLE